MKRKFIYDNRWQGHYGIARYAQETTKRIQGVNIKQTNNGLKPLSPAGLLAWQFQVSPFLNGKNNYYYSPSFVPVLGQTKKQIITIHDLIHLKFSDEASSFKKNFYNHVVLPVVKNAPVVFTVSEYSRADIAEWAKTPENKIVVTGNAASTLYKHEGQKYLPGFQYLLYVGNHKPHKNTEILFKSLQYLSEDIHLVCVGELDEDFEILGKNLGVSRRIHELSNISEAVLAETYRGALATVMPSLHEGFGIPVLESMASGTPVISSRCSSLPEIGGDSVLYFDPNSVESLIEQINILLSNETLRKTLVSQGILKASEFSWDHIASKITDTLNEI